MGRWDDEDLRRPRHASANLRRGETVLIAAEVRDIIDCGEVEGLVRVRIRQRSGGWDYVTVAAETLSRP